MSDIELPLRPSRRMKRKPESLKVKGQPMMFYVTKRMRADIERYSNTWGCSLSEATRRLVDLGLNREEIDNA